MRDQLETLRLLSNRNLLDSDPKLNPKLDVTLITSGKGGVGKSVITALFALYLSRNYRTGIMDMDFQMADQDVLFQVNPPYSLLEWIKGEKSVSSILYTLKPDLKLLPGISGNYEALKYLDLLVNKLKTATQTFSAYFDHLLIDWGTGMWEVLLQFAAYTRRIVIVSDTTPTSLTDTYALIKLLEISGYERDIYLIINKTTSALQGKIIFNKLEKVIRRFLGIKVYYAGSIARSEELYEKLNAQNPINEIALSELEGEVGKICRGIFFQRLHPESEGVAHEVQPVRV